MARNVLTLRVSSEDKERWQRLAKEKGMKLGEWIRMKCDEDWSMTQEQADKWKAEVVAKIDAGKFKKAGAFERKPVGKIAKMMEKK